MRIALVYPPPWKIAGKGESAGSFGKDGPPPEYKDGDLDAVVSSKNLKVDTIWVLDPEDM